MTKIARLGEDEIRARLAGVPGWERAGEAIRRLYAFRDFREAIGFVNRVAGLADAADHHPDILIEYSKVTLTLATHDAGGITERDFALARAIDTP
jgi:4a-hydroxytetrahydrobiopterin dehydratase